MGLFMKRLLHVIQKGPVAAGLIQQVLSAWACYLVLGVSFASFPSADSFGISAHIGSSEVRFERVWAGIPHGFREGLAWSRLCRDCTIDY